MSRAQEALDFSLEIAKIESVYAKNNSSKSDSKPPVGSANAGNSGSIGAAAAAFSSVAKPSAAQDLKIKVEGVTINGVHLSDSEYSASLHAYELAQQRQRQLERDAQEAASLQYLEQHKSAAGVAAVSGAPVKPKISKLSSKEFDERLQALIPLQKLFESKAMTEKDIDAHTYTKTDIRNGIPQVIAIDDKCKFSNKTIKPETILKEVLEFVDTIPKAMNPPNKENIKKTFLLLMAQKSPIEAEETHANVPEFLSRVWSLTKKFRNLNMVAEAMGQIAIILDQNIADKGGCMAGLVARLYPPFVILVDYFLKDSLGMLDLVGTEFAKFTREKNTAKTAATAAAK